MSLTIIRIRYLIHIIFLSVSLLIWIAFVFIDFRDNAYFYYYLLTHNLEERRAMVTYEDFYKFLKFCDQNIPKAEDIVWVFSKNDTILYNYLTQRAYYHLLPRNYRKNANFVIVYDIWDYKKDGFTVYKEYGPGRFILQRQRKR